MNILLSSVGRRSYLVHYFKEALRGRGRVIGANCIAGTQGLLAADVQEIVPPCHEPSFIPEMLALCRRHQVSLLLSLHDLEIAYLSPQRDLFRAEGVFPVLPDADFARICHDKLTTMEFAQRLGIAVPTTFISLEAARGAIAAGTLTFPVIVKPREGFGSIGLETVHSLVELEDAFQLVQAMIQRTPIARGPGFDAERCVLVQQKVEGAEYGIDVVNDLEGRFAASLIERKLGMRGGETDAAVIEAPPALVELGRIVGGVSRNPGNLDLDVILRDGVPHLLEMNPRFGGHYPFAHVAGANVPAALIAWAQGEPVDPAWLNPRLGAGAIKDFTIRML